MIRSILILFTIIIGIYSFQNCGEVSFNKKSAAVQPDSVDGTEIECVEGKTLGIWGDTNNNKLKDDNEYLGEITSYKGDLTAQQNYNYYSYSAHPLLGPQPDQFTSYIFFYDGADGLSFNFYFNVDEGGSVDNEVQWKVYTKGNNKVDKVLFLDDPSSKQDYINVKTLPDHKTYDIGLHYYSNTDGAILGPFQGEDFSLQIDMLNLGDNQEATFYSADGSKFTFKDAQKDIKTFFISYKEYKVCN